MISNPRIIQVADVNAAMQEIGAVGACGAGVRAMANKAIHLLIRLDQVPSIGANIIKQEMLSKGGECAVSKGTVDLSDPTTSVLLMGTVKQYRMLIDKLKLQQFKLPAIAKELEAVVLRGKGYNPLPLTIRDREFAWGSRSYIMGILNITPDSFSDGGRYEDPDAAINRALAMVAEGADIIDVGAESSRPGYAKLTQNEEEKRLFPILEQLVERVTVPISVDTRKSEVARKALDMGASMINDISGLVDDVELVQVAAATGAPLIIMHNRDQAVYGDLMGEILWDLREKVAKAIAAGVQDSQIIIDPGIGFGKTPEHNLVVMGKLDQLQSLGYPILVGPSRKSFIGKVLDLPVNQRLEGTAAAVTLSITLGADIIRVHDVQAMKRVALMTDAMLGRLGG
jgi:dihydropteroate synthase